MLPWGILLCFSCARAIDPNRYENLFMLNWPMFEKITEKVVNTHATDVLDLGCGPGQPSLLIAKTLPSAQVHATDVQEEMIKKAKKRAEGVSNLKFSVVSADDLSSFGPKSFDAVTMNYVLMFVPDKQKSLREIGRVLRAGGRAFISVWKRNPFFTLSVEAYAQVAGEEPMDFPVNPLALAKEGSMESLIEATHGLLVLEHEETVSYPFPLGTADEACDSAMIVAGSWLEKLKKGGRVDAKERFCESFVTKLEENGMKDGQVYKAAESALSEGEALEEGTERDAKSAARKERKAALKAMKRERRAQSPKDKADAKRKPCDKCNRSVDLLVRCRIDVSQKWFMLCGRCWHSVSGGVPDGDSEHPHYKYGGLWKNRAAKVTTPSFAGAKVKADLQTLQDTEASILPP